jgi:hypothetical protein
MRTTLLIAALSASAVLAQQPAAPAPVTPAPPPAGPPPAPPQRTIPPQIVLEVRELERQFDQALLRDCAPERCSSKGCVYKEHLAVDLPANTTSLPGLGQGEGPGAVAPQLYLTQARCEFTHEKTVPVRDVEALARRLEQRLSKGFLRVTVSRQVLDPINPSLAESPPPKEDKPPEKKEEPKPEPPAPPPKWDADVALRELWQALLPHFSWMIAVFLATLAALTIIWAARRLGKESLEEKAMAAQLANAATEKPAEKPPEPLPETPAETEAAFAEEQQRAWAKRIADAPLEKDDALVGHLLREWLRQGEYALLAKATVLFGDRLSLAFQSDATLAPKKAELARFLKQMDAATLPSDAQFFRTLNQNAVAASLLAQPDTEVYRSLQDEFGTSALVQMIEKLPPRQGALLFALSPLDRQDEVARLLPYPLKVGVAHQLLQSNRSSRQERAALFDAVGNAREGKPLKNGHHPMPDVVDQGQEFDAATALSVLLSHLEDADRHALFEQALSGDGFPGWYENILSPQMLLKVPAEQRADLLLEVDVRGLAAWLSLQPPARRDALVNQLSASVQTALRASMTFGSRAEQLELARKGQGELVASVKRRIARGALSFPQLVN